MAHRRQGKSDSVVDAALAAMDADQLRELVRAFIPWLDDATQARLMNEVVERAARESGSWAPKVPTEQRVEEIKTFAAAMRLNHQADPSEVDDYLRDGTHAFLAREYAVAFRIFRALLIPLGEGDIDLGHHELIDEVLGVDVDACATQYVVAMYMTAAPKSRARAVYSAIEEVQGIGYFFEPLQALERVALEPLPDYDGFLAQWSALLENRVAGAKKSPWDKRKKRWLREVLSRTQGPEGLAELARRSRSSDDLSAWCLLLMEAGDWTATRTAYEEAAELAEDLTYRGDFLDGAALAAQELGSDDLSATFERAWRQAPTWIRLQRWLAGCTTRVELVERAGSALDVVPTGAARQRALLHILRGEFGEAAALLAEARGLGWSESEHPGHLLFPIFVGVLGGTTVAIELPPCYDDLESLVADDRPKLGTPPLKVLLRIADVKILEDARLRPAMIEALRTAAKKRIEGVTEDKRRSRYGQAASLAVQCARVDGSPEGQTWLRELRDEYRRYPALKREFKAAGA
jgi:hypothetical protein